MGAITALDLETRTEPETLADRVSSYIGSRNMESTAVAREVGYSRSAILQYLKGEYKSNPAKLEAALESWLERKSGPVLMSGQSQRRPFYESRDAKDVLAVCRSCQEYREMGIITGRSGFGKTYALKTFAKLPKVAYIECDVIMSARDLLKALETALGLPHINGTNEDRANGILEVLLYNRGYLLIIDEADKLMSRHTQNKMHVLRAIYDRSVNDMEQAAFGMVIAGEPQLKVQIQTYMSQQGTRTIYGTELSGLTDAEVEGFLTGYDLDADALAELKRRARNPRTGCFRLLDRTMRNVRRLTEEREDRRITLKLIEQASNLMLF